ncbi:MAG: tyrosine-type recombinase/integrase [Stellaceae bacterium]
MTDPTPSTEAKRKAPVSLDLSGAVPETAWNVIEPRNGTEPGTLDEIGDRNCTGLYLRLYRRAGAPTSRTWYFLFRKPGEATRHRVKLGTAGTPALGYIEAVELADAHKKGLQKTEAQIVDGRARSVAAPVDPRDARTIVPAAGISIADAVREYVETLGALSRNARRDKTRLLGRWLAGTPLGYDKPADMPKDAKTPGTVLDIIRKGRKPLRDMTLPDIAGIRNAAQKVLGKPQARKLGSAVKAVFNWARDEQGYWPQNVPLPLPGKAWGEDSEIDVIVPLEGLRELVPALLRESEHYGSCLLVILATGARPGEVMGMRRGELDLEAGTWTLPSRAKGQPDAHKGRAKTKTGRTIPLSPFTIEVIRAAMQEGDYVFSSKHGKKPITRLDTAADRIAADCGVTGWSKTKDGKENPKGTQPWTPHDLRRTFATLLVDELKFPPHVADAALGHALPKVQRTYTVNPLDVTSAFMKWGELLEGLRDRRALPSPQLALPAPELIDAND